MITDDTIILRAPEPGDVDAIYRWENDPQSWTAGLLRQPISRQRIWEWVSSATSDPTVDSSQARYIIALASSPCEAIGCIDLEDFDWINRRSGVGVYIENAFRGRGFASRALQLLIAHSRRMLGLHQLFAIVAADNSPSRALFVNTGFEISGRLRSWIRDGESYRDAYLYQKLLTNR